MTEKKQSPWHKMKARIEELEEENATLKEGVRSLGVDLAAAQSVDFALPEALDAFITKMHDTIGQRHGLTKADLIIGCVAVVEQQRKGRGVRGVAALIKQALNKGRYVGRRLSM